MRAIRHGAGLMGMEHGAGQVREGFPPDLPLADGDPVADVRIPRCPERLVGIMKGGETHKPDRAGGAGGG